MARVIREVALIVVVSGTLSGCSVNKEVTLRNDAGETKYCYLNTNQSLARLPAEQEFNKCLNDLGAQGYRQVSQK